jgi:hypothetical protein
MIDVLVTRFIPSASREILDILVRVGFIPPNGQQPQELAGLIHGFLLIFFEAH